MNPRIHNAAMKMGVRLFLPPLQGSPRGGGATQGSAPPPSTLGYIPAAASRLKRFAALSDKALDGQNASGSLSEGYWG